MAFLLMETQQMYHTDYITKHKKNVDFYFTTSVVTLYFW